MKAMHTQVIYMRTVHSRHEEHPLVPHFWCFTYSTSLRLRMTSVHFVLAVDSQCSFPRQCPLSFFWFWCLPKAYYLQFGMGIEVILTRGDNSHLCLTANDLLPLGFTPDDLRSDKFVSPDSAIELDHSWKNGTV